MRKAFFFINKPVILANAAHVVECNDYNLVVVMNLIQSLQDYRTLQTIKYLIIPAKIIEISPINDVCILEISEKVKSIFNISS